MLLCCMPSWHQLVTTSACARAHLIAYFPTKKVKTNPPIPPEFEEYRAKFTSRRSPRSTNLVGNNRH
jgi:hypothetical protein